MLTKNAEINIGLIYNDEIVKELQKYWFESMKGKDGKVTRVEVVNVNNGSLINIYLSELCQNMFKQLPQNSKQ